MNKREDKIDAFWMRFKSFRYWDINKFVPRNPSIHKVVGSNQSMQTCWAISYNRFKPFTISIIVQALLRCKSIEYITTIYTVLFLNLQEITFDMNVIWYAMFTIQPYVHFVDDGGIVVVHLCLNCLFIITDNKLSTKAIIVIICLVDLQIVSKAH